MEGKVQATISLSIRALSDSSRRTHIRTSVQVPLVGDPRLDLPAQRKLPTVCYAWLTPILIRYVPFPKYCPRYINFTSSMAASNEQKSSTRGPAQPSFVFRGHTAQIHSAHIVCRNTCLVTGDADGWIVVWKLETKRALAVWKAHDGAILETAMWGSDKIITYVFDRKNCSNPISDKSIFE